MKHSITTIAALLFFITTLAQSKTENEITALSNKRVKWLLENNSDSLAMLYDVNAVTVHGNGMVKSTEEQLQDIRKGLITYESIEIKETTVRDFGTTAILVGKGVFNIAVAGNKMTANMAYTEVYMKKSKNWKLIARHASEIR